MKKLKNYI